MNGASSAKAIAFRVRSRLRYTTAASNVVGGIVVFLLLTFGLPRPSGVSHQVRLILINAGVLVVTGAISIPIVSKYLVRQWEDRMAWISEGRDPTERERNLTVRFPLTQQAAIAVAWAAGALLFGLLNLPFSAEVAFNVSITLLLGGLVMGASGYLLCERELRPITALALSSGVPEQPQLPGVGVRALLSWALSTGAVLLGMVLLGIGGIHESRFSRERLGIDVLVLSFIGILIGLLITAALASSLAEPIDKLRRAVDRVGSGDLDQEVEVDDASEVGLLQAGFNRMLAGLREREQIRDLFGRQVGEDVVHHALEHGVRLGGESRDAAVLFVDLQGSTSLAETRDPAEVVSLLNDFFAIVIEAVAAHDGWVNKFEGDAALCVFGAPLADPDASTHALAAARELAARLAAEITELTAGIGVSAGRVVAGNVGAARRFEYTVIGDPVNAAARLSELAKQTESRVLASGEALGCATDEERERWRAGEPVQLRGRSAATAVAAPRA